MTGADAGDSVTSCARQTFEALLSNAAFLHADGLVSGLILAEDWWAAQLANNRVAEDIQPD
ncbi:MAG: hypothetical protein ACYDBH_04225 [Acidobacteriaceae bacterium]